MSQLFNLDAPNIQDSRTARPGEVHKRIELAKWLSDWHLIAFLGTTQLIAEVRWRIFTGISIALTKYTGGSKVDHAYRVES
jgi:hypothetical protein